MTKKVLLLEPFLPPVNGKVIFQKPLFYLKYLHKYVCFLFVFCYKVKDNFS